MLADDRDGLGRRHVAAWCPVFLTGDAVEVFFDDLLAPGESVSSAHAGDYCRSAYRKITLVR